jgi:AcrR family transcriptional regulator
MSSDEANRRGRREDPRMARGAGQRGGRSGRAHPHRPGEPRPPIWAREQPRGRGPAAALSRDQIADTALAIADAEGIDAVSIRRLARDLRSGVMSLYHYFDSRDELLELMADRIAAEMVVPGELPGDWREALHAIAKYSRAAFTRHPWLHTAMHERMRVTPNLMRHIEQSAQAIQPLVEAGYDAAALSTLVAAVDDYTVGYTIREGHSIGPEERAQGIAEAFKEPYVQYLLDSGEFPLLSRFIAEGGDLPETQRFEEGLDWLLDGFAAKLGL